MATPPIGQTNLITYEQFNELLTMYNSYWADDNTQFRLQDLNPSSKELIRTGWGQDDVEPQNVNEATIILAEHANQIVAQINAGLAHMSADGEANPLSKFKDPRKFSDEYGNVTHEIIFAQALELVKQKIESIEVTKNDLNPAYADMDVDVVVIDAIDFIFDTSTKAGVVAKFSDYQEARYFFNGGGQIIFNLGESVGDNNRGLGWADILQGTGTIKFGANTVATDGYVNPIMSLGFYDCIPNTRTRVFEVSTGSGGGEYADEYGFGSEYDSANIKLWAKVIQLDNDEIEIYLEVELIDPDDGVSAYIDLILEVGVIVPDTAPKTAQIEAGNATTTYADLPQQPATPDYPPVSQPYTDLYADPGYVQPGYVHGDLDPETGLPYRDSNGDFLKRPLYYQYEARIGPALVEYYDWNGITNTTPYTLEGYVEPGYIADP